MGNRGITSIIRSQIRNGGINSWRCGARTNPSPDQEMNFRFHPQALEEFEAAARYYEERKSGLGERFAAAIELAIDGIVAAPAMWPILEVPIRRRLVNVFPYAILFVEFPGYVLIVAVMHCHREPGYWKARLGN